MSQVEVTLIGGQLDGESCTEKAFNTGGYYMYTYMPSATNPYEEDGESIYQLHTDGKAYCVRDTKYFVVAPPEVAPTTINFGMAIHEMKLGKKVARKGWNGKGMWLVLVPGTENVTPRVGTPYHDALGDEVIQILPHIDMYTVDSTGRRAMLPGWLASQSDMLANDWIVVK
jgi:hypothetical protein